MDDAAPVQDAPAARPMGTHRGLTMIAAGLGMIWALAIFGIGSTGAYNAWTDRQSLLRAIRSPGVTHWNALGSGLLPAVSVLIITVLVPLTLAWLVVTVIASVGPRRGSARVYLTVTVLAVLAVLVSLLVRRASIGPENPFHPALLTRAMDGSLLLALDGLFALAASIWFLRRAPR